MTVEATQLPAVSHAQRLPAKEGEHRFCRSCGCHDRAACLITEAPERAWNKPGEPCWWVEEDLCSACSDHGDPRLVWEHPAEEKQSGLSLRERLAFGWVGLAMCLALLRLLDVIH